MGIELKDYFSDDDDDDAIMTIAMQYFLFKRENEELPTATSSSRYGPTIRLPSWPNNDLLESRKNNQEQWYRWCSG